MGDAIRVSQGIEYKTYLNEIPWMLAEVVRQRDGTLIKGGWSRRPIDRISMNPVGRSCSHHDSRGRVPAGVDERKCP